MSLAASLVERRGRRCRCATLLTRRRGTPRGLEPLIDALAQPHPRLEIRRVPGPKRHRRPGPGVAADLDTSSESRAAVEATVEATNKLGDARGEPVFVVENVSEAIGCAAVLPVAPAHMATKYAADGAMLASEAVGNASFWRSQVHGDEELAIAAIVADMSFLESGGTPQELMDCTLWDNGVPASILDAWRNAQRWMRKWEGFEFWTGWYRSVIGRRAMAKTLLREVARIEPSDWSLGPKHVSNIIEKIELAWIRASSPLAGPDGPNVHIWTS